MDMTNKLEEKRSELEEKIIDMWVCKDISNDIKENFLQTIAKAEMDDILELERILPSSIGLMKYFDDLDKFFDSFMKRSEGFEWKDIFPVVIKDIECTVESLIKKGFIEKSIDGNSISLSLVCDSQKTDVYDLTENEFFRLHKIISALPSE